MGIFLWNILDIEFFYIESFLFLVWVFVPLQNKILLFKVKFHMYMCSLVCIIMRILISYVDVYLCVICFFKVYRYLTWCNNVFSFIFCYCCNQLNTSQSVSQSVSSAFAIPLLSSFWVENIVYWERYKINTTWIFHKLPSLTHIDASIDTRMR